jgi:hypothetical protein
LKPRNFLSSLLVRRVLAGGDFVKDALLRFHSHVQQRNSTPQRD